jgi:alkylation response protein AidB-like acyl-CoA dehydrogenase
MDFNLSEDQRLLKDEIVRFAKAELSPGARERDEHHEFPRAQWDKCGEMGLQGLMVPPEYGGSGLDALSAVIALEALGYGCDDGGLVFSICAHLLACVVPIWKHGTEAQKQRYLPDLCKGRLIAVNAMTEPAGGSDAFAMKTRAVEDGDHFVVNGAKTFSSNGPVADLAVLYANTNPAKAYLGGVTAFLVEASTPGFVKGQTFHKMGLRSCAIGELVFEDARVPRSAVLGAVGGGGPIFAQSMEWERVCLVAAHVGTMQRLLEQAVEYARTRKVFGKRIGEFQAVSHAIADMKVRLEASRLLVYHAASRLTAGRPVGMDASITKLFVSEALVKSAMDTVQILGGYGFMTEYGVERTLRDAVGGTIYSGTSQMQRNIIAGWLGL